MAIRKQAGLRRLLYIVLALMIGIIFSVLNNDIGYILMAFAVIGVFLLIYGIIRLAISFKSEDKDIQFKSLLLICLSVPMMVCPTMIICLFTPM